MVTKSTILLAHPVYFWPSWQNVDCQSASRGTYATAEVLVKCGTNIFAHSAEIALDIF